MNRYLPIRPFVSLIAISCAVTGLHGQNEFSGVNGIISFGDSLTDAGNVFATSGGTSPLPAFYTDGTHTGRFTDGLSWVDYSAQQLSMALPGPSVLGGTNYAWGGAMTGSGLSALSTPNVGSQILQFQVDRGSVPANSLVTLWAGSNDYLSGGVTDPNQVVGNLLNHATELISLGADRLVVVNLPDLSQTPLARGSLDAAGLVGLNALVNGHNALLAAGLANLRLANPGVALIELDAFGLMNGFISDPVAYGFSNVIDPVYTGSSSVAGSLVGDPSEYLFFDALHPTSAAHSLFAIPEPAHGGLLLGLCLAALIIARRRKR